VSQPWFDLEKLHKTSSYMTGIAGLELIPVASPSERSRQLDAKSAARLFLTVLGLLP
jgi:hypothetical protein